MKTALITGITGLGTVRLLEAIRKSGVQCRLYQASGSGSLGMPQRPKTSRAPSSMRASTGGST